MVWCDGFWGTRPEIKRFVMHFIWNYLVFVWLWIVWGSILIENLLIFFFVHLFELWWLEDTHRMCHIVNIHCGDGAKKKCFILNKCENICVANTRHCWHNTNIDLLNSIFRSIKLCAKYIRTVGGVDENLPLWNESEMYRISGWYTVWSVIWNEKWDEGDLLSWERRLQWTQSTFINDHVNWNSRQFDMNRN